MYEKYCQMMKELNDKYKIQWKYLPFLDQLAEFKSEQAARLSSYSERLK